MSTLFKPIRINNNLYLFCSDDFEIFKIHNINKIHPIISKIRKQKKLKLHYRQKPKCPDYIKAGKISIIGVDLVSGCNLNCKYCYISAGTKKIEKLTEDRFIDILNYLSKGNNNHLIFSFTGGGENTLNYELMQKIPSLCKKYGFENCSYYLITNGTMLTEAMIAFFKQNNFTIHVSLDGNEKTNDINRVYYDGHGTFNDIIKNVNLLKANNIRFSCNMLLQIDRDDILDSIKFFEYNKINFSYDFPIDSIDGHYIPHLKNVKSLKKQFENIMNFYRLQISNNIPVFSNNVIKDILRIHKGSINAFACDASYGSFHISIDGLIFPCSYCSSIKELSIGSIYSGINYKQIRYAQLYAKPVDCYNPCKTCWIKYLCCGGCLGVKWVVNKNTNKPYPYACAVKKAYWESIIKLYIDLVTTINIDENCNFKNILHV